MGQLNPYDDESMALRRDSGSQGILSWRNYKASVIRDRVRNEGGRVWGNNGK